MKRSLLAIAMARARGAFLSTASATVGSANVWIRIA